MPTEMVDANATRSPVIHLVVTDAMAAELCESLNLRVEQIKIGNIQQPQTKSNERSFAAPYGKNPHSTPTNQKALQSRLVKTKQYLASLEQNSQVDNFHNKLSSPQGWQLIVDLFLVEDKELKH